MRYPQFWVDPETRQCREDYKACSPHKSPANTVCIPSHLKRSDYCPIISFNFTTLGEDDEIRQDNEKSLPSDEESDSSGLETDQEHLEKDE